MGTVPANGDVTFSSTLCSQNCGKMKVKLYVNGNEHDEASSNCELCYPLTLTSVCDGTWSVHNPNNHPVDYTWKVYEWDCAFWLGWCWWYDWMFTGEQGSGTVPANGDITFTTSMCAVNGGSMMVKLYAYGDTQDQEQSNCQPCSVALTLTSVCDGVWNVHNPNPSVVAFTWNVTQTAESGAGSVPAGGNVVFATSNCSGSSRTANVMVGGVLQDSESSTCQPCVPLKLVSLCDGSWRVVNSNPVSYPFTWRVVGSIEGGSGTAAPGNTTFTTSTCAANGGSMIVQIVVGGVMQDGLNSNCRPCSPPVTTTTTTTITTTVPTQIPPTTTTTATTATTTTTTTATTTTNTTGVVTTTTTTPPGAPTLPLFLLLGGAALAVLIPILVFIIILYRWVAADEDSLRILRTEEELKKLRRIVVPQKVWDILQGDKALKADLEDAGVKIKVQPVEEGSPVIKSLVKQFNLHVLSAQAVEAARLKHLKYAWVEGKRLKTKELLEKIETA